MDLTDLWVMFNKRQHLLLQLIIAILVFGVGWQMGRVMSPYYTASPIVFQDRNCNGCSSAGGSPEQLEALRQEGTGLAKGQAPASPEVAGARSNVTANTESPEPTTGASVTEPAVASASSATTEKQYVASVNSNLYHDKSCPSAKRIKPENQVWFSTTGEAEAAGYSPSACTQEKLGNTK